MSAVISECGTYRYWLERTWGTGPRMGFIMLNPSTADAEIDDPTIRRCIGFAKREGCGGLAVVNVFAFRATDPSNLPQCPLAASGPENAVYLHKLSTHADGPIIAAWGANAKAAARRFEILRDMGRAGRKLHALKVTKSGSPGHPLYIHSDAPLVEFGTS